MRNIWLPFVALAPPMLGPSLAAQVTGQGLNLFFEQLFARSLALYVVSVAGWLGVSALIPRMEGNGKNAKALGIGAIASALIFGAAANLFVSAAEINALKKNAVVGTVEALQAQWNTPWGQRSRGIFVHGTLRPPSEGASAPQTLAFYSFRDGGASSSYFPLTLGLVLSDGHEVQAGCIQQVVKAVNWPEGERAFSRALKEGDPVIVWGDPAKFQAMGSGKESYGVQLPRAIIYARPEELESVFLGPARRTARPVGWMALAALVLCWLPIWGAWKLIKPN